MGQTNIFYGPVLVASTNIIGENDRVQQAVTALTRNDIHRLGELMFESHQSSRENFNNSCPQPDELVAFAKQDPRCIGARLSGGGFGGISIHLLKTQHANAYQQEILSGMKQLWGTRPWSTICRTGNGADTNRLTS